MTTPSPKVSSRNIKYEASSVASITALQKFAFIHFVVRAIFFLNSFSFTALNLVTCRGAFRDVLAQFSLREWKCV